MMGALNNPSGRPLQGTAVEDRAERAAIRAAVTSAMAAPGTGPESAEVIQILERLRAGESPVAIARQTGALRERGPGPHPTRDGVRRHDRASGRLGT
jgi:hypothetical protein